MYCTLNNLTAHEVKFATVKILSTQYCMLQDKIYLQYHTGDLGVGDTKVLKNG